MCHEEAMLQFEMSYEWTFLFEEGQIFVCLVMKLDKENNMNFAKLLQLMLELPKHAIVQYGAVNCENKLKQSWVSSELGTRFFWVPALSFSYWEINRLGVDLTFLKKKTCDGVGY